MAADMDAVFKALADRNRRLILDRLFERNGQSLTQLHTHLEMSRQAASKHLDALERAGLVTANRDGRETRHHLNPVPIQEIHDRWIRKYESSRPRSLSDPHTVLEKAEDH